MERPSSPNRNGGFDEGLNGRFDEGLSFEEKVRNRIQEMKDDRKKRHDALVKSTKALAESNAALRESNKRNDALEALEINILNELLRSYQTRRSREGTQNENLATLVAEEQAGVAPEGEP